MADSDKKCCSPTHICIGVLVGIIAAAIILGRSFQTVEYYEYAFVRQISTGEVDRSTVYNGETVVKGPDYDIVSYNATAHKVRFDKLQVATFDRVGIELSLAFQYFLRKDDLALLHDEYRKGYKEVIIDRAKDSLKAKAPSFTIRQYVDERKLIEREMFMVVRQRQEGKCCHQLCQQNGTGTCLNDCKSVPESCPLADRGVFVEVRYFQLLWVSIAYEIGERYLQALILQEKAETSELKQTAAVVRTETELLVQSTKNEADVISRNAVSQEYTILNQARTDKNAIIEDAGTTGQRLLYNKLNISTEEHRNSFDYLRTLRREPNCHVTVDFQQRTIGSWTKN